MGYYLVQSYEEPIDSMKPDMPDLPEIKFPNWMPEVVIEAVKRRLEFLRPFLANMEEKKFRKTKDAQVIEFYELNVIPMKEGLLRYINTLKPGFESEDAKGFWLKLNKKSAEVCKLFVMHIFHVENTFDGVKSLLIKHDSELKMGEEILKKSSELVDLMEAYPRMFFGHFLCNKFKLTYKTILEFNEEMKSIVGDFKEEIKNTNSYSCSYWPITREMNGTHALPLYFLRKNYFFFQEHFKKPMHSENADFVNALFQTNYSDSDVAKAVSKIKNLETGY